MSDRRSRERRRGDRHSARGAGGLSPWWGALAGLVVLVLVGAVVLQRSRRPTTDVADAVAEAAEQAVQRISASEAAERVDRGLATLYDVRSPAEFEAARAAGARFFPENEGEALVGELPSDGDLIFY